MSDRLAEKVVNVVETTMILRSLAGISNWDKEDLIEEVTCEHSGLNMEEKIFAVGYIHGMFRVLLDWKEKHPEDFMSEEV